MRYCRAMLRSLFHALTLSSALLAPLSAAGEQVLDGPGFDALTRGRTYIYSEDGREYGAEQYLPGHRVNWSFLDGRCLAGKWWEEAGNICFVYEDRPDEPLCWQFWQQGAGLMARVAEGGEGEGITYSARPAAEPLYCMGPDAGV